MTTSNDRHDTYERVAKLARWSEWVPFVDALTDAPRVPGVYLFRAPGTRHIIYAGMAGERAGSGVPQGLRGRLRVHLTGKGAVSGFGEAALDRALADPSWVEKQLRLLSEQGPQRAKVWAANAIQRVSPEVCWATCSNGSSARALERQV